MSAIFDQIIYRPIFNLLIFIYNLIPGQDFGLAIIALTIMIRLLFLPLSLKTIRSQKQLTKLQPKLKELQERHKSDKQALGQATMALYQEHKVNPFSGCLPLLIQLPVLIALYKAFTLGLNPQSLDVLYPFVTNPGTVSKVSLGFLDLSVKNRILAATAGILQWLQSKLSVNPSAGSSDPRDVSAVMSKQMLYFFPVIVIIIAWNLPAGLVIYWVVNTLFSITEQAWAARIYS